MRDSVTTERLRVRYGETDAMGHVYYANYLLWFEQARGAWCRDRGFTYKQLEERGYKLPAVEAHLKYRGECKYDDLIEIRVKLAEVRRSSMRFEYEVINLEVGKLATEGYTIHVLVDHNLKSVAVPDAVREWLGRDPRDWERLE